MFYKALTTVNEKVFVIKKLNFIYFTQIIFKKKDTSQAKDCSPLVYKH